MPMHFDLYQNYKNVPIAGEQFVSIMNFLLQHFTIGSVCMELGHESK